jgi:hypothetical protein
MDQISPVIRNHVELGPPNTSKLTRELKCGIRDLSELGEEEETSAPGAGEDKRRPKFERESHR